MIATVKNLTNDRIRRLSTAAAEAGDIAQVAICDLALTGSFDRDDWSALDGRDADRVEAMTRDEAYAAIVEALNDEGGAVDVNGVGI